MIVNVLIPLALNEPFSYNSVIELSIGDLVSVPFGNKYFNGLVVEINLEVNDGIKLKNVKEKLNFHFKKELIDFIKWTADYYLIPVGNVLNMMVSPLSFVKNKFDKKYKVSTWNNDVKITEKQQKILDFLQNKQATKQEILTSCDVGDGILKKLVENGLIQEILEEKKLIQSIGEFNLNELSKEQQKAFDIIQQYKSFQTILLEGTTGSGKTEVYFHLIVKLLKETDKQALILLPEIALTTQLISRFEQQFNFKPAVWHSEISQTQKSDIFNGVSCGTIRVMIGTRSSLFLPFNDLGLIIVDEEHDSSYKQSDNGCYNGRDLAVLRAKLNDIPVILSSATPSLETLINVDKCKYKRVYLPSRFGGAVLPDVEIVDLKKQKLKSDKYISKPLIGAISTNLQNHKQSMIFMNRRGYSPVLLCGECGAKIQCPNCSSNLTYHKSKNRLICHHCEYFIERPKICPVCGSENLIEFGPGVEKIEREIKDLFPQARTIIMASDTTDTNKKLEEVVNKILNNEIDIIIGTQLVAKGHHFPNLTVVGIVDSDASLFGGDIRASERTYQLLTQVSGRAGREEAKGTVYFQSYNSNNLILQAIKEGDKNLLLDFEKQNRELGNFPPYGKMATISVSSLNETIAYRTAKKIASNFPVNEGIEIFGASPAFMPKLAKMYRFNVIVKTNMNVNIQKLLRKCVLSEKYNGNVRIKVEIE
ncbi:MAG: primosomal protein N' [Rickettsiales bacterium]|nr:primosomal protein N' [Rickettsiales bacterium]